MNREFETKILDIDVEKIIDKLILVGAEKIGDYDFRRIIYDTKGEKNEWVRLRTDGFKTTLTYKRKDNTNIDGTVEIESEVEDFESMSIILDKFGYENKYYQENKRVMYKYNDIEFSIDFWPQIPPYLEVEGENEDKVIEGLNLLNLNGKDIGNKTVLDVYKIYGKDMNENEKVEVLRK